MRCVFTSDWHFGKLDRFFSNHEDIHIKELEKVFKYAVEKGIENVIVGGDISDDVTLSDTMLTKLVGLFIEYECLSIHIILGNHDIERVDVHSMPLVSLLAQSNRLNVKIYDKPTHVVIDGIDWCMLPFPYKIEDKPINRPSVNLLHLEWHGAKRDNGTSITKEGYSYENTTDYNLVGHFHTPQFLTIPKVLYCGSLVQLNFGETRDKSFCECQFKLTSKGVVGRFRRIPINSIFELINLTIHNQNDLRLIEDNKYKLYKLWINNIDVILPDKLMIKKPNVISINGIKNILNKDEFIAANANLEGFNIANSLRSFMDNDGLTTLQQDKAFTILQDIGVEV